MLFEDWFPYYLLDVGLDWFKGAVIGKFNWILYLWKFGYWPLKGNWSLQSLVIRVFRPKFIIR